jgi:hypothetical protein
LAAIWPDRAALGASLKPSQSAKSPKKPLHLAPLHVHGDSVGFDVQGLDFIGDLSLHLETRQAETNPTLRIFGSFRKWLIFGLFRPFSPFPTTSP